ncbi:MAG: hypothetical protein Alis3KO_17650 [Aliiglaciecola sp.]|uniref:hypothetical protein n=1 Tax=Aliiglaciecola sp. M165 TaxID=2593649 RepID=UPI0021B0F5DF|nr:hypothetical protein [Aliiglaciecola sp. M165]
MQEHGEFEVGRSEQVILLSARGPWNDETLKSGAGVMNRRIQQLDQTQPWAQLSCLFGESLMTPSAFKYFTKHTGIRKEMGLTTLAIVIKNSDITSTIKMQLTKAYSEIGIQHEFFEEIEQAIEWLQKQGINLYQPSIEDFFNKFCFTHHEH